MDNDRINEKLDTLASLQATQNDTLIRLTVTVEEHVRRSNMLEKAVNEETARIDGHDRLIEKVRGAFWALGTIGSLVILLAKLFKT